MASIISQVPGFKESRLRSLYSDFSHLKEVNPEGYDANISAWCDVLDLCLKDHYFQSTITLPGTELASKLADPNYGHPKGLASVLDSEIQNGKYVPWSIYKFSSPEPAWNLKDYFSPMRWVEQKLRTYRIGKFSLLDGKGGVCNDYFINWHILASTGDRLGEKITAEVQSEGTYSAKLLDSDLFMELVKKLDPNLSDLDIQVLLIYLSRDCGKLTVVSDYENARRAFVKVDNSPITEEDFGIIKIKANIRSIQARTDILAERLDKEIPEKIRTLLQRGKNDERLRNVLVQKTYVTKFLNKSLGILSQLNMILDKINDAQTNVSVYDSLRTAKGVLAFFNNQISFADLDKIQLELDEEIAISNELTDALVVTPDMDERAIDDEMEELEREYIERNGAKDTAKNKISEGAKHQTKDEVKENVKNEVNDNIEAVKENNNGSEVEVKKEIKKDPEAVNLESEDPNVVMVDVPRKINQSLAPEDAESKALIDKLLELKLTNLEPSEEKESKNTERLLATD